MKEHVHEHLFIERIIHLLCLLDETQIEIDQIAAGRWPTEYISLEDEENFKALYETIEFMDHIPGGFLIYYADEGEQIIYANRGLLRMFQCETMKEFRKLTGNSFRGVVHPDDIDLVENSIRRQIFENKSDLDYVEYRIRRKDGSVHWVEDYGHFIHTETVGDIFYVFLGDSADERNQQQMAQKRLLKEAMEKANLAIKAKNTFVSHVSHDMRTPLNAIFGFTFLAKESIGDNNATMNYLNKIENASQQLLDMITQVLDAAALPGTESKEDECEFQTVIHDACSHLVPKINEKSIEFSINCDDITHNNIYADNEKLKQLIFILAENAVNYTNPGGSVDISVHEKKELSNDNAVFSIVVKDTGIGIGEEFLEHIFEPFSREKNSTLSGIPGIGLGLTIAKNILDIIGGTIDVKSAVGEGSTFTVTLSFRVQPMAENNGIDKHRALKVLLVEDNEINLEIESEILEHMGFVVEPAENGKIALDKVEKSSFSDYDLIIMDLQMPLMNGWQAASAIRKLPDPKRSEIPIIALSTNFLVSDLRKSKESGINAHLTKPMNLSALLETIEQIMKNRISESSEN